MTGKTHSTRVANVVHLITLLELGGAQGNTIHTVRHLNPIRFYAQLWAGKGAFWDLEMEKSLGARLRFFPCLLRQVSPIKDFRAMLSLRTALIKERPDILHTHSSKAGILGRIAGRLAKIPVVVHTYHGFGFNDQQKPWTRWLFVLLERWTAAMATRLIFVSRANLDTARRLGIGRESQYVLIRSGIPLRGHIEKAHRADRDKIKSILGIPSSSSIVTTIGPFKLQKNTKDFLLMARELLKRKETVHFLIVGDGEERDALMNQQKELGLTENVHFLGWRDDIPQLLAATDVFAMTSLWEGLPRAMVEAMALGIPAVCYDTDGVRDLLNQGGGILIRQGDTAHMASIIYTILEDAHLRSDLSGEAKQLIGQEFDIDDMVRQQESLYATLLNWTFSGE